MSRATLLSESTSRSSPVRCGPSEVHRLAAVDEEVDWQILFFLEQFQDQAVQPQIGFPVEVPEVIATDIRAIVRKLQAGAALLRAPLGAHSAAEEPLRHDV